MTDRTSLGDRMKLYERMETDRYLLPCVPIIARLDGRAFHSYCRGMKKPFDDRMIAAMEQTTRTLVDTSNACIGYTQSDEITLIYYSDTVESQVFFNGKIHKLTSVLAAMASTKFASLMRDYSDQLPVFDCRVWSVPNKAEAVNCLRWREQDACRNSLTALAQAYYSHNELQGKDSADKHEMLHAKGVNWNDLPPHKKRGSYWQRVAEEVSLPEEERLRIPEKHRPPAGKLVTRHEIVSRTLPPIGSLLNGEDVVFEGDSVIFR